MEAVLAAVFGLALLYAVIYFAVLNAIRQSRQPDDPVTRRRPWADR